jgi:integrase
MSKIITPLTDTKIKNAKPKEREYKLFDGKGLYLNITPKGYKWWRFKYKYNNRDKLVSFGVYPEVSLQDARHKREIYRKSLANNIDPSIKVVSHTFEEVALKWFETNKNRISDRYAKMTMAFIKNYLLQSIGSIGIRDIKKEYIIAICKNIEKENKLTSLNVVFNILNRIYRYAVSMDFTDVNIISNIDKATIFKQHTISHHPTIIGDRLKEFLVAVDNYNGNIIIKYILQLLPHLFLRPTNVRFMEWSEIDFDKCLYRIPKTKMKNKNIHLVPLSKQSVDILNNVREYTKECRYVFQINKKNNPISDYILVKTIRELGFGSDELVLHSFRGIASTILNESINKHGIHSDVIERQLAHKENNATKASYNHAEYMDDRIKLMQWWSNYLDELKGNR